MANHSMGKKYPSAHIALNNNRLKAYEIGASSAPDENTTFYLNKDTEFQIELNNPTSDKVLAKFTINGKEEEYGLVLNPGQRFYLDRFMDKDSRFRFDTYFIPKQHEGISEKNNGVIKVKFYKEEVSNFKGFSFTNSQPLTISPTYGYGTGDPYWIYNSSGTFTLNSQDGSISSSCSSLSTANYANTLTGNTNLSVDGDINIKGKILVDGHEVEFAKKDPEVETGRVEEGSKSNQTFNLVSDTFQSWCFFTSNIKLIPMSKKPQDTPVRQYCTECGAKTQKKFKFCAQCGSKL